jgi:hypothetical protein
LTNITEKEILALSDKYNLRIIKVQTQDVWDCSVYLDHSLLNNDSDKLFKFTMMNGEVSFCACFEKLETMYDTSDNTVVCKFITEYPLGTHIDDKIVLENFIKKQIRALDLAEIMEKKIRMDLKINSIKQDF